MFDRQIDVKNNVVFIDKDKHVVMDCSFLLSDGVIFVAEKNGEIWVEREPYNGRETNYDFSKVYSFYAEAETEYISEMIKLKEIRDKSLDVVTSIQLTKAAEERGEQCLSALEQWVYSPERTLIEKMLWWSPTTHHRDSDFIKKIYEGLLLNSEHDQKMFFELAKSFR
jgi:hypothetical protein